MATGHVLKTLSCARGRAGPVNYELPPVYRTRTRRFMPVLSCLLSVTRYHGFPTSYRTAVGYIWKLRDMTLLVLAFKTISIISHSILDESS